jgi:hypothetical protein
LIPLIESSEKRANTILGVGLRIAVRKGSGYFSHFLFTLFVDACLQ